MWYRKTGLHLRENSTFLWTIAPILLCCGCFCCGYLGCNFCFVIHNIRQKLSIVGYSESLGWHKYSEASPPLIRQNIKIKNNLSVQKKVTLL